MKNQQEIAQIKKEMSELSAGYNFSREYKELQTRLLHLTNPMGNYNAQRMAVMCTYLAARQTGSSKSYLSSLRQYALANLKVIKPYFKEIMEGA